MKLIKLCYDDPDLFQTSVTSLRCDFIMNHFEGFIQMYKSQGSTFWLRLLVSFKTHVEEKFCSSKKWLSFLMNHFQFIKVLNFIYVSLHKKFIEGSNTAVKKLINNLITLALNSPSYLNYSCEQWLIYIKSSKQLHNIFQNLFGVSEPAEYNGFTAFIFTVYTDFFCALCSVFEQWYKAKDLTEEELKKVDSKIIYWLPNIDTETKIKPSCFEKYISDHWKENLQRMLLTDNIHNIFSVHATSGCCDKFDKEKNIFKVFQFTDKHTVELMKILYNQGEIDDSEESVRTVTEVCMKDVCTLKPQAVLCTSHKKCYVKICHLEGCLQPYICEGSDNLCSLTCETKVKNTRKQEKKNGKKPDTFWKTVSAEVFPIDKKKRDVCTLAESSNRDIYTYLHVRESYELDMPLSVLKHTYHQCLTELHNFDLNPRKAECVNRLRKKLSQKHPSSSFQFNVSALRQPYYRESLFENALSKMMKFQEMYCLSKGHNVTKCLMKCFMRAANTVAISTSNAFGRVVLLSKTIITIPYELSCDGKLDSKTCEKMVSSSNVKHSMSVKKTETKKNINGNRIHTSTVTGTITITYGSGNNPTTTAKTSSSSDNATTTSSTIPCITSNTTTLNSPVTSTAIATTNTSVSDSSNNTIAENSLLKTESNENVKVNSDCDETLTMCEDLEKDVENPKPSGMSDDTEKEEDSDDDIDKILELIGSGESEGKLSSDIGTEEENVGSSTANSSSADDKALEDFFKLIGVNEAMLEEERIPITYDESSDAINLKVCAYCKKKEIRRKQFKKCSRCKEENFPVQHYYCSRECLLEDWAETHEEEHSIYSTSSCYNFPTL